MNRTHSELPKHTEAMLKNIEASFKHCRMLILDAAGAIAHVDKKDGTPVTEIDHQVEAFVLSQFKEQFDVPIYGEETGYSPADLPITCWLIDPIDGTSSLIKNSGTFTCMAVLIHNEKAVASIIYDPTHDESFTAVHTKGARKNDEELFLPQLTLPSYSLCKGRFIEPLDALLSPSTEVTHRTGPEGAGFGFIMVADGRAAAIFKLLSGGFIHDYAVGGLLIEEAGGVIIPILEDTYTYRTRSFVACHPLIAQSIKDKIADVRALEDPSFMAL